jgi:hypothetical protein
MKKRWFTLIELLIVIILLWVLMVSFSRIFQIKNKDVLYWEACTNNIYWDISNFLYSAISSKALFSWSNKTFPEYYNIEFNLTQNSINFSYSTGSTWANPQIQNRLQLTWNMPQNYNCHSNLYNIILSGQQSLLIQIKKWLSEDKTMRSFIINPSSSNYIFTWMIKVLLVYKWSNLYKEVWIFDIDTRNQSIKAKTCITINNQWTCWQRSQ